MNAGTTTGVTTGPARPSRREQRREQTVQEIKTLALAQIATGGPDAVSLTGIARTMAMSPAAVYRYFDNRDALLADLVVETYGRLADALEAAHRVHGTPAQRFSAVARASRAWALDQPNAYRLIFQTTTGSGQDLAPDRTIPAAARSMTVLLTALAELAASVGSDAPAPTSGPPSSPSSSPSSTSDDLGPDGSPLTAQVRDWASRTSMPELSPRVLALGLASWTRLHGVVSLELGHHLESTGIDPALLYEAEVAALLREATAPVS